MKNKLYLSLLMVVFGVLPAITSAESNNRYGDAKNENKKAIKEKVLNKKPSQSEMKEKREGIRKKAETKRESFKSETEQKRESVRKQIERGSASTVDITNERINGFIERVIERFDAAINRLERLADRLDSRIVKMEAQNIDTSEAKALMATARIKIDTAKLSRDNLVLSIKTGADSSGVVSTSTLKAKLGSFKIALENARKDVKVAHTALVDVVNNLKPSLNKTPKADNSPGSGIPRQ